MKNIKTDHLITVPSERFTWTQRMGIAELTDTGHRELLGPSGLCRQVWEDACDVGFVVESRLTGKQLLFILSSSDKTRGGEVTGFHFTSAEVKRGQIVNEFKLVLLND